MPSKIASLAINFSRRPNASKYVFPSSSVSGRRSRPAWHFFGILNAAAGLLLTNPSDTASLKIPLRNHRRCATGLDDNFRAFRSRKSCNCSRRIA